MQKVKCNICLECGDGYWAGEHKNMTDHNSFVLLYGGEDEPPPESRKNSFKLCLSGSRDLYSALFGCGISPQSRYNFGNLVMLGSLR